MPQFYVSLLGGGYTLVEHQSIVDLASTITRGVDDRQTFVTLSRPDGKTVLVAPNDVTLIQPPAPPAFRIPTIDKEKRPA
jgi:hypothetical protein